MREVLIPATGFAMTEALLLRWHKQPGEAVSIGEPIAEIETDKTSADIESPATGVLGPHLAAEGSVVQVGVALTLILEDGDPEPVVAGQDDSMARTSEAEVTAVESRAEALPSFSEKSPVDQVVPRDPSLEVEHQRDRLPPRRRRQARLAAERAFGSAVALGSAPSPPRVNLTHEERLRVWLETMLLIREFESRCDPLALAGKIPGGVHLSIGQEAVAVGVIAALQPIDLVAGTHRSHHHAIAMGIEPRRIMAELFGKAPGTNGGRGGSMHIADLSRGFIGGNGIVGAGVGLAMGAALGAAYAGRDQVVVGFVGDGGVNTGRTWEAANLAAIWHLPLIIVCENNLYAVETTTAAVTAASSIADRAAAFGLHAVAVDGQDVEAVYAMAQEARARAVAGGGPTFIEAKTYRYEGHNTGQVVRYRSLDEVNEWRTNRDPIERLKGSLVAAGVMDARAMASTIERIQTVIDEAIDFAQSAAWPDPASAPEHVTSLLYR